MCNNLDPNLKSVLGKAARLIDMQEDEGFGLGLEGARRLKAYLMSRVYDEATGKSCWQEIIDLVDDVGDDIEASRAGSGVLASSGLPEFYKNDFTRHYAESGFGSVAVRSKRRWRGRLGLQLRGRGPVANQHTRRRRRHGRGRGGQRVRQHPPRGGLSCQGRRPAQRNRDARLDSPDCPEPLFGRGIYPQPGHRAQADNHPAHPGHARPVVDGRVAADEIVFEKRGRNWAKP